MTRSNMKRWRQVEAMELKSKRCRKVTTIQSVAVGKESIVPVTEQARFEEALAYLKVVRDTLKEESKYREFVWILKEFQNQNIDAKVVVSLVKKLFRGHMAILVGFNAFLPKGYKVDPSAVDENSSYVCEDGKVRRHQKCAPAAKDGDVRALQSSVSRDRRRCMSFDDAVTFVNKVKLRFYHKEQHVYTEFLEILNRFRQGTPIWECTQMISTLFSEHADLVEDFHDFVPMHLRPLPSQFSASSRSMTDPIVTQPNTSRGVTFSSTSTLTSPVQQVHDVIGEKSRTSHLGVYLGEDSLNVFTILSRPKSKKKWKRSKDFSEEVSATELLAVKRQRTSEHWIAENRELDNIDVQKETEVVAECSPVNVTAQATIIVPHEEKEGSEDLPIEQFTKTLEERKEDKASTRFPRNVRKQVKYDGHSSHLFFCRMRGASSETQSQTGEDEGGEALERSFPTFNKQLKKRVVDDREDVALQCSSSNARKQRKKVTDDEDRTSKTYDRVNKRVVDDREDIALQCSSSNAIKHRKTITDDEDRTSETYRRVSGLSAKNEMSQQSRDEEPNVPQHSLLHVNEDLQMVEDNERDVFLAESSPSKVRNISPKIDDQKEIERKRTFGSIDPCTLVWGQEEQHIPGSQTLYLEVSPNEVVNRSKNPDKVGKEDEPTVPEECEGTEEKQGEKVCSEVLQHLPPAHVHPDVRMDVEGTGKNEDGFVSVKKSIKDENEYCIQQVSPSALQIKGMKSYKEEEQDAEMLTTECDESGKELLLEKEVDTNYEKIQLKRSSARIAVELFRKKLQAAGMPTQALSSPLFSSEDQERKLFQQFQDEKMNLLLQKMQVQFYEQVKKTFKKSQNSPELSTCLEIFSKEVMGCDQLRSLVTEVMEDQELEYSQCRRITPSYCHLPKSFLKPLTKFRTKRIQKVLNDTWVSVGYDGESRHNPLEEGSGSRKQIGRDGTIKRAPHDQRLFHEERLSLCEDDQFELDVLRETISNTIQRVAHMVNLTQAPGFNVTLFNWDKYLTPVNLRCIERIYCEFGLDFIEQARKNCVVALPVILHRLRQKGENEWAEYQMEMNKVWAAVHSEHYHKSQDYCQSYGVNGDGKPMVTATLPIDEDLNMDKMQDFNVGRDPDDEPPDSSFEHPDEENLYQIMKYLLLEVRLTEEQFKKLQLVWAEHVHPIIGMPPDADGKQDLAMQRSMPT